MEPSASNVSGPDWVAAQVDSGRARQSPGGGGLPAGFHAWGPAALALGLTEIIFSAITHVVAWLYASLASSTMSDLDTRLGLTLCILYTVAILALAVVGVIAGFIGVSESRRLGFARGISFVGLFAACIGLLTWIMASINLLIVAIYQLR